MGKEIDISSLFISIVDLNKLDYKDISYICERPESTVFKWLNKTLVPKIIDMIKIHHALRYAGGLIPRELARLESNINSKGKNWGRKRNINNKKPEYLGEKLVSGKPRHTYIYDGENLSINELIEKAGVSRSTIVNRLKKYNIKVGDEIKPSQLKKLKTGRPGEAEKPR